MNILYLGWVGANNIGDELMLNNFKKLSKEKYGDNNEILGVYPQGDISNLINNSDMLCLGGGSILLEGFIDILYDGLEKGKKIMVWGSGYDGILGRDFIDRLEKSRISPYLYSDTTEFKLDEIAKNSEFFGVRGPLTYKILEKSNVDISKIKISGDPGFLLDDYNGSIMGTNTNFKKSDKVVAVNIGTSYNRIYGGNEGRVLEGLVKVCDNLIVNGYTIYLYSLWSVDLKVQIELYKRLIDKNKAILDLNIYDGEKLKSILKNCVFSINLKLHGNIISATADIPFICLGYRLKAYDFLKSIDLEQLNVPTDTEDIEDEIMKKVSYIENNYESIKSKIKSKIDGYKIILKGSL